MKEYGNFNKISPKLREQIKKLKPGEFMQLQQLEKKEVQDPDTKVKTVIYPQQHLWLQDQITDPHTGEEVKIGIVARFNAEKNVVELCEQTTFESRIAGIHILDGSNPLHRQIYEFLQVSNFVEDSLLGEYRDKNAPILFRFVDNKKTARQKSEYFDAKEECLRFIRNMQPQDMKEFCAAKGWPYHDEDLVNVRIREYADTSPLDFKKDVEDPTMKRKAAIKYALDENIIVFNPAAYSIAWANGSGTIATMQRIEGQSHIDAFCDWSYTAADGDKIIASFRKKKPVKETA